LAYRFLSKEWAAEVRNQLEASRSFQAKIRGANARIVSTITEPPGGGSWVFEQVIADGALKKLEVRSGTEAAGDALLRVQGSYEAFARLNRGELTLMKALLDGSVKVQGDLSKAMPYAPAILQYHEIARSIKTVY